MAMFGSASGRNGGENSVTLLQCLAYCVVNGSFCEKLIVGKRLE